MEDQIPEVTKYIDLDSWQMILSMALLITMITISTTILILMLIYMPAIRGIGRKADDIEESVRDVQKTVEDIDIPSPVVVVQNGVKKRGRPKKNGNHKPRTYKEYGARASRVIGATMRKAGEAENDEKFFSELEIVESMNGEKK